MSKGKLIIITLILLFVSLVSFLIWNENKNKSYYLYLFTGSTSPVKWYYNDNTWYIVNDNKKLNDKFSVYSDGNYKGNYNLLFSKNWYYFDDNNQSIKISGDTFMINTNYRFKFYQFSKNIINDSDLVNNIIKKLNINNDDYQVVLYKYDIDNNEKLTSLYTIDFIKKSDEYNVTSPSYSAVFTYNNGKINLINDLDFTNKNKDGCSLNVTGIIKFNNNNNKLLLSCTHYDQIPNDYYLFEQNGNKYKLLVDSFGGEKK